MVKDIFISENSRGYYPVIEKESNVYFSHEADIAEFLKISVEEFENKQVEYGASIEDEIHGAHFKNESDCQKFIDEYMKPKVGGFKISRLKRK